MPEMVAAEVRQENRLTVLLFGFGCFLFIIVCANRVDRPIDHARQIDLTLSRAEYKSGVASISSVENPITF